MTPELAMKLHKMRQEARNGPLSLEELKEAIHDLRVARGAIVKNMEVAKKVKKAPKKKAADLLLDDFINGTSKEGE